MVSKEELDVVSTLLILKSSEDLKVKASANGTLWNLRVDLEKTEGFRELGMFILISYLRNKSFAGQKSWSKINGLSQGFNQKGVLGAQWLSGRVLDLRLKGCGFEPHRRHCVVSLSKTINPSLVLVQPRKTYPYITERLLMGRKESNKKKRCIGRLFCISYIMVHF